MAGESVGAELVVGHFDEIVKPDGGSVRLLGRRRWTLLHTVGSYAIWGAFTEVYAPLTFKHPGDAPFLAFLIAALGLRAARRIRSMRRST